MTVETAAQVLIKPNAVAAVVFLAIYIILFLQLIVVGTVLHGEKIRVGNQLIFPLHLDGVTASQYGSDGTIKLLVAIFSTCFVSYYFINWKYLSGLWLIR